MADLQGITIEYKNNFFGTFISTLVAVLVAVPVAMFISYTLLKANNASASTFQQTATASPVTTVGPAVATTAGGAYCTVPATASNGSSTGGTADMSYLPGGGIPQYVVNNTSSITQNQSETNTTNTTVITDSYNDNSTNDSYNTEIETDIEVDVEVDIEDSFQDNDTQVQIRDSFQDNSTDVDIEDSFTIEDSFQDNSVTQTAIGLLAGNINSQED